MMCSECHQPLPQSPICANCQHPIQLHNIEFNSMPCSTWSCECTEYQAVDQPDRRSTDG